MKPRVVKRREPTDAAPTAEQWPDRQPERPPEQEPEPEAAAAESTADA